MTRISVTDSTDPSGSGAGFSVDDSAALRTADARHLLDVAVSRSISVLAHDMRNSIGVVSMQVEAISMRAQVTVVDAEAIQQHADAAAEHIENLADMMNALIAFARGRASSDLSVIFAEVADLVPLRPVLVVKPDIAPVAMDPLLTRAVALEVLNLALGSIAAPTFAIQSTPGSGAVLDVTTGTVLPVDDAVEWVVQFRRAGGQIASTDDGLTLTFPPTA
jgi:signal transduction histidine kinase